jgi:hypothetical protein
MLVKITAEQHQPGNPIFSKERRRLAHARLTTVLKILNEPRRWISVWFLSYALLGAISSGLLPILLPLMIVGLTHHLSWVAYVMGGFNLGLRTGSRPTGCRCFCSQFQDGINLLGTGLNSSHMAGRQRPARCCKKF